MSEEKELARTVDTEIVRPEQPPEALEVYRNPFEVLDEAHHAAKALTQVVSTKKKKVMFNGEQYLEFEDWQTVGKFYKVTAGEDGDPEYVTVGGIEGFKASAVAYLNGQVISRATQYCMRDEPNWSRKPIFQLSSMAQTRANAKVLRNVLAWVVVLAGYRPTPAEEMDSLTEQRPTTTAHQPTESTKAETPQPPPPASGKQDERPISEAQIRRFWAIAHGSGWKDPAVRDYLMRVYGIEHTADIKRCDYEEICIVMQAGTNR